MRAELPNTDFSLLSAPPPGSGAILAGILGLVMMVMVMMVMMVMMTMMVMMVMMVMMMTTMIMQRQSEVAL